MGFKKNGLVTGSIILLVTFNLFNILNLAYSVLMARTLSISDYGILMSLMNLVLIFAVFSESVQTVLSKYSAKENSSGKLKNILNKSFRKALFFSSIFYASFLIISIFISPILKVPYYLLALSGIMLFASFFNPITRGILQGRKRFLSLGSNMVVEGSLKLLASILLIYLGFRVGGAILGAIIGSACALLVSYFNLKDILSSKEEQSSTPEIYQYSKPVFVATLSLLLFLSLDVILAKIFFSPDQAGVYAIASTLAKIIFIGTQPLSRAMFPISASSNKTESDKALKNSFLLVLALVLLSLLIIWLFPGLLIFLYSGKALPEAAGILLILGTAMGLLSLTNLLILHALSRSITENTNKLLLFVLFEVIILSLFHSTLFEFSLALLTSSALFFWGASYLMREKDE